MRLMRTLWLAAAIAWPASGIPAVAAQEAPSALAQNREVVRVGQDFTLGAEDAVGDTAVIFGDADIAGRVYGDMVVVFGAVQLASTASVDGNLVVVGGSGAVSSGAQIRGDLVIVGGAYDAPPGFSPRGGVVVIDPGALGGNVEAIVPWITRGLFWGRPIVPELGWVWGVVGIIFLVSLALNLVFDRPVRACAGTLVEKPLTALAVGLLVLLLAGPVCLLLAVSIVGLAVVPFVFCALVLAWILGKVGVARGIGMTLVRQTSRDSQTQAIRSFIIGFAVLCVAYMVPVLGFAAWAMSGVAGLGAATLAVIAGYRRENPDPPAPVPSVTPTAMKTASYPETDGEAALPVTAPAAGAYSPPAAPAPMEMSTEKGYGPFSTSGAVAAMSDLASFPRAPFHDRLAAFVLDVILVAIARQLLNLYRAPDNTIFLLLLAYHIGFWTWKSTTVGGIICQLRVVRVDGTALRFVDALVRGLSSIFSLAVLGIGCLWILKDPERQAWHDKIAGTYVVKVPRDWPL
jgi:uncharacterized RDD family membrane protein YckC